MSFIVAPLVNAVVQTAASSVSHIVWYAAGGVWWVGKRMIFGRQATPEDIQQRQLEIGERQLLIEEKMLAQQTEMLNLLKTASTPGLQMLPPNLTVTSVSLEQGTYSVQDLNQNCSGSNLRMIMPPQ